MFDKVADATAASTALTSTWWLPLVTDGYQIMMAVGAAVFLALRIAIAWREWREGQKTKD